jgi:hypothetical protein
LGAFFGGNSRQKTGLSARISALVKIAVNDIFHLRVLLRKTGEILVR